MDNCDVRNFCKLKSCEELDSTTTILNCTCHSCIKSTKELFNNNHIKTCNQSGNKLNIDEICIKEK